MAGRRAEVAAAILVGDVAWAGALAALPLADTPVGAWLAAVRDWVAVVAGAAEGAEAFCTMTAGAGCPWLAGLF